MSEPLYAYAIVDHRRSLPSIQGVGGAAIRMVRAGRLAAVAAPVDVGEFEGEALEKNLSRPGWLETTVRAHERVVEALAEDGTVLPMRFGSIFSDGAGLRAMLQQSASSLAGLLERLRGRVELGVTVRVDRRSLAGNEHGPGGGRDAVSGRDYLRHRQAELRATATSDQAASALAERVHAGLSEAAERASLLTPRRSDPSVVLVAAYLVPDDGVDAFSHLVEQLRRDHAGTCQVDLTGPWPPYSFASIDVAGARF